MNTLFINTSGQKANMPIFGTHRIQGLAYIGYLKNGKSENHTRTCPLFEWFRYSNVCYLDPHCSRF